VDELLEAILGPLIEFLLELVFGLLISFFWRKVQAARWKTRRISLWFILPFLGAVGAVVGWISIGIIPSPVFHPGRFHGFSLIMSPLLTGLVMAFVGSDLRRRKEMPAALESFSGGFSFAFGMALVRFLHVAFGIGIARKNRSAGGAGMGEDRFHEHDDGFCEQWSAVGDEAGLGNAG
jgi:hypothetical protein